MSVQGAASLSTTSIRHVGDYQLTAHLTPNCGYFSPELLVSKHGGITMRRHTVEGLTFSDPVEAYTYAKQWMSACLVTGDGFLLEAV